TFVPIRVVVKVNLHRQGAQLTLMAIASECACGIGSEDHGPDMLAQILFEIRARTLDANDIALALEGDQIARGAANRRRDTPSGARLELHAAGAEIISAAPLYGAAEIVEKGRGKPRGRDRHEKVRADGR